MLSLVAGTIWAFVLFVAASSKLAAPLQIRETLSALGVPAAGRAAIAVSAVELATAAALVLEPESPATMAITLGLGVVFAAAGLFAIVRRLSVHCACFGPALAGRLGVRQLLLLPIWIGVAFAGALEPSPLALLERAQLLVAGSARSRAGRGRPSHAFGT